MVKRKRSDVPGNPEDKNNDQRNTAENTQLGVHSEEGSNAADVANQPSSEIPKTPIAYEGASTRNRTQQLLNKCANASTKTENTDQQAKEIQKSIPGSSSSGSQRTSSRNVKKAKNSATNSSAGEGKKGLQVKQDNIQNATKTRRSWELWTVEDTNAFFEALCEYGKDFDSIQSYMAQRTKKKGFPARMWKNKEQVRHFYYRTWHKISKHLTLGEDVKKETQELYGLINYARLRKKMVGGLNQKNMEKLNELVLNGVTLIKFRGKRYRIKTPVCKALKKLNNVEEVRVEESLPSEICLEFRAASNSAWVRVQSLAQNPRLRTTVSLQKRLSSVIEYLEKRWKPYRQRLKDQILSCLPSPPSLPADEPARLRVRPRHAINVASLSISAVDVASSSDVCLETYKKNVLKEPKTKESSTSKSKRQSHAKIKSKASSAEAKSTANSEAAAQAARKEGLPDAKDVSTSPRGVAEPKATDETSLDPADEARRSLSLLNNMLRSQVWEEEGDRSTRNKSHPDKSLASPPPAENNQVALPSIEDLCLPSRPDAENLTLGELLGMAVAGNENKSSNFVDCELGSPSVATNASMSGENTSSAVPCSGGTGNAQLRNSQGEGVPDSSTNLERPDVDEKIKKGWTAKEAGLMTVGELYLMLKQPAKIVLEYEWIDPNEESCNSGDTSSTTASDAEKKTLLSSEQEMQVMSKVLKNLLLMASTSFTDWKNKQVPVSASGASILSATRLSSSRGGHHNLGSRGGGRSSHSNVSAKAVAAAAATNASSKPADKADLIDSQDRLTTSILHQQQQQAIQNSSGMLDISGSIPTVPVCGEGVVVSPGESHVFVVPVGTAPRNTKVGSAIVPDKMDPVKDRIEKLLPPHCRRGRIRNRKPLLVRHPLLPRNVSAVPQPRPMTVVRLLPTSPQLGQFSAMIPATSPIASRFPIAQTKKVVKIVSTSPTIDVGSIHVPLLKSTTTGGVISASGLNPAHVVVSAAQISPVVAPMTALQTNSPRSESSPVALSLSPLCKVNSGLMRDNPGTPPEAALSPLLSGGNASSRSSPTMLKDLSLSVLAATKPETISNMCITTSSRSPPQISIPEESTPGESLPPACISSFLEMSAISEGLPTEGIGEQCTNSLLADFEGNSNSSLTGAFSLSPLPSKSVVGGQDPHVHLPLETDLMPQEAQVTPPHSPTAGSHFKFSSPGPDSQWLNGESTDLSLSSLFTMDSPCKSTAAMTSSTGHLPPDSVSMDAMTRLGPDVDTHLQCLLNENSVDYVAKFADLAAQIAASGNENKAPS